MRLQKLFLYSCLALLVLTGSKQNMFGTTYENNSEDEGMSDGAMAGLIAGSVAGLAVGATAIGVGIKKYRDDKKENAQSETKGQAVDGELQKNLDQTPAQEISRVSTTPLTPSLDEDGKEVKSTLLDEEQKKVVSRRNGGTAPLPPLQITNQQDEIRAKNINRAPAPLPPVRSVVVPDENEKKSAALKAELEALKAQDPEGQQRALEEQMAQNKQRSEALKQDLQQGETEQKKLAAEMEEKKIAADKEEAQLKDQEEALKQKQVEKEPVAADQEKNLDAESESKKVAVKASKSEVDVKSLFIDEKKYIKSAEHMRGQVSEVALRNIERHQKVVARYIAQNAHIVKLEEQIKLLKEDIKKSEGADMLHKKEVLRLAKADLAKNKQALAKREANIEKGRAMIEKQIGSEKYKELFPKDVIKKVRKQEFRKAENKIQRQESKIAELKRQIKEHSNSVQDTKKILETKLRYDPTKGAKGNEIHNTMMKGMEEEKSELQQKKQKLQEKEQKLQKNKHLQEQRAKIVPRHF